MTRTLAMLWLSGLAFLHSAEAPDLLRFANGDQLHGTFRGIGKGPEAIWQRDDLSGNVEFKTGQIRHIVLRGGRPVRPLESLSNVALVNGDKLPGKITALDADSVILETAFAGTLRIPRAQVSMLAPSPLGGRIRYHGPFSEDEWKMANVFSPDDLPRMTEPAGGNTEEKGTATESARWRFSGSSWYWTNKEFGTSLYRENALPDRAILRFDLAWKNRLSFAIAFHSDMARPKPPVGEGEGDDNRGGRPRGLSPGDSTILPALFGNSYVLQMFSTHMMLFRTSVNEDGESSMPERVPVTGNGVRLGESGKATIELRCNRASGEISLFVNDEFVIRWNEGGGDGKAGDSYAGKGNGFGFLVQGEDAAVKISDIMVAEWNGMPDAARSLQVDEQDIVLLANGTDRFSGKVISFDGEKLLFEGKFGRFQFQLDDIAEIRFARNHLAKESETPPDDLIVRLNPLGRVSGRPVSGDASSLRLVSPVCGELDFNLDSAVMLDFQGSGNFVDDWEVEF